MNGPYAGAKVTKWLFAVVGAVIAVWMVAEHWPHLLPYVPWLLLAACPLMHIFMHHGKHGAHEHHSPSPGNPSNSEPQRSPPVVQ